MLFYKDDLHGYDGLSTFGDIFPNYVTFKETLKPYLFFLEFYDDEAMDTLEKFYIVMHDRYRSHFFRFKNTATIKMKMAWWVETVLRYGKILEQLSSENFTVGATVEDIEVGNTNNTRNANRAGFQTNYTVTKTIDPELYVKQQLMSLGKTQAYMKMLEDMKILFMNRTNQLQNSLYAKGENNGE